MDIQKHTDQGRSSPGYRVEDTEKVLDRYEQLFGDDFEQLTEMFRALPKILEEIGFNEVSEFYTERWETLPFKTDLYAYRWKDPYTALKFYIKIRVKEPYSDKKTREDMYKGKLKVKAYLVTTKYPHWEYFEEDQSMFQRSWPYRALFKLVHGALFRKEREKYREEAEELALELISRIREVQGVAPAIGRSRREWYRPEE